VEPQAHGDAAAWVRCHSTIRIDRRSRPSLDASDVQGQGAFIRSFRDFLLAIFFKRLLLEKALHQNNGEGHRTGRQDQQPGHQ